ncbi:MAG: hypothetical protein DMF89_07505 [Acidobacteria bacterium]|nr:MAG: hypothetical protein DMF90_03705 [Acidobacteriota bacterium]PYR50974.1 MAG: hypothetical protein DMF89_07505 [Acidobacteriota bacterium]
MRYFKSWLFRIGLVLTAVGVAACFVKPLELSEVRWASSGGGTGDLGFFAESVDYSYTIPIVLTLGGLVVMAVAVAKIRLKARSSN